MEPGTALQLRNESEAKPTLSSLRTGLLISLPTTGLRFFPTRSRGGAQGTFVKAGPAPSTRVTLPNTGHNRQHLSQPRVATRMSCHESESAADRGSVIAVGKVKSLPLWPVVLVVLGLTGCGGSSSVRSSNEYPLVEQPPPKWQPPVRRANGSVVRLPALPTVYQIDPSTTCERQLATFHDGSEPPRRPVVIPPRVGLEAVAITKQTTRLQWSFRQLPADCRPEAVLLSVSNWSHPGATPTNKWVPVRGLEGSTEITYPDFLPSPNVAIASAHSNEKRRGRTVSVLIRRSANLPLDPPEPASVTAPAGKPIACTGQGRIATDPVGDILTYRPGSPPAPVRGLSRNLSGIDIRRAAVRIDDRTICAGFVFAQPPSGVDFQLTLALRDASASSCCASLRFRRSARGLELGYDSYNPNGTIELRPVENAGAELRGNTLTISGTLPPPSAWHLATRQMPTATNVGWTVSTRYVADRYGPFFGDWLPRYDDVNQSLVRHRDGATVRPSATP